MKMSRAVGAVVVLGVCGANALACDALLGISVIEPSLDGGAPGPRISEAGDGGSPDVEPVLEAGPADATDAADASDAMDASDATDDAMDATDAMDAKDAMDATDAMDEAGDGGYPTLSVNDRFWHDGSGNVIHQDAFGNATLLAPDGGYGASSSVATYAYPQSGVTAWFLDTLQPAHLRQIYLAPSGGSQSSDWGTAPSGCAWTGNPAVSSWGEGRGDVYVNAVCSGQLHLFHEVWQKPTVYAWTDITPPGVVLGSSPAAAAREPGVLDVIVMSADVAIVHGSCKGTCNGAGGATFVWDAPSSNMTQGGDPNDVWNGDPALASPSPGVLRAFIVDFYGNIDFSEWSSSSPAWSASRNWYSAPPPNPKCESVHDGPAVARTAQSSLFVVCTRVDGALYGGWGDTVQSGSWYYLTTSGVSGGAGISAH